MCLYRGSVIISNFFAGQVVGYQLEVDKGKLAAVPNLES